MRCSANQEGRMLACNRKAVYNIYIILLLNAGARHDMRLDLDSP